MSKSFESKTIKGHPLYNNSAENQRKRLLDQFAITPRMTVQQIVKILGILAPPARVKELRELGHSIKTIWVKEDDANGVTHHVGLYVYCGLKKNARKNGFLRVIKGGAK